MSYGPLLNGVAFRMVHFCGTLWEFPHFQDLGLSDSIVCRSAMLNSHEYIKKIRCIAHDNKKHPGCLDIKDYKTKQDTPFMINKKKRKRFKYCTLVNENTFNQVCHGKQRLNYNFSWAGLPKKMSYTVVSGAAPNDRHPPIPFWLHKWASNVLSARMCFLPMSSQGNGLELTYNTLLSSLDLR